MPKPVVSERLIMVNHFGAKISAQELIVILCRLLTDEGYVDASYTQAVLEREKRFPTALPTLPYATAIPHANGDGVRETGVAVAILSEPVAFAAMESPKELLPVRLVLLMAVADSSKQVTMLQWICNILNRPDVVAQLASSPTPHAAMTVLEPLLAENQQGALSNVGNRQGGTSQSDS